MKSFAVVLCLLLASTPAFAITVTTYPGAEPESITAAPDGGGETKAKPWIDVSADGNVTFLGVLSDIPTNTLWGCEIGPRVTPASVHF